MPRPTPIRSRLLRALTGTLVVAGSLALAVPGADAAPSSRATTHVVTARPGMLLLDEGGVRIMACASYVPTGFGWLWDVVVTVSKPEGANPAYAIGIVYPPDGDWYSTGSRQASWWGDVVTAFEMWAVSGQAVIEADVVVQDQVHTAYAYIGLLPSC